MEDIYFSLLLQDKLATKIATTQTFVSGEVEAVIGLQRAAAEEVMNTFEAQ